MGVRKRNSECARAAEFDPFLVQQLGGFGVGVRPLKYPYKWSQRTIYAQSFGVKQKSAVGFAAVIYKAFAVWQIADHGGDCALARFERDNHTDDAAAVRELITTFFGGGE